MHSTLTGGLPSLQERALMPLSIAGGILLRKDMAKQTNRVKERSQYPWGKARVGEQPDGCSMHLWW